ncbi:TonB-dependent siderophore receptor [Sporomusa sp. KB1]|jgi:outer membrane cobalamin receptor|uniref:TonB-dependent receptor plug domain-containing protein n=1 Tax=Sporomusa sp. KB1 TaxID=943346 RepID=UPI0011A4E4DD|nr:TonB-dependent receptor [Sporomusa sp. KB1]TWH51619.1 outer membrane receptor for ferrienterochelin and colicin [Sporomusa sp. KB1]TWH52198.1 outer membrane receptor for ferrienterochelin and colicin [Sporomusa sp. KB1]
MKKKKLAFLASCLLLYSSFPLAVTAAEEANTGGDTEVEEVVVTAAAFKQLNPVKFTVITEDEIKSKGAQNAADALKDVTGLYITSSNTKGKAIAQFRGSDADNTKIFIDGVPLSPVGDGKVDLRNIPADNIEKIEIIKGAVPVIYGTDAPGGVIYITTKKATQKMAESLTITSGSNNTQRYFASVGGDTGKFNYNFTAKKEDTDGYTAHSKLSADYYSGKMSWDINNKSSLTLFGSYSERQEEQPNRIDPATGLIVLNSGRSGATTGKSSYWSNSYDWEYDPIKNSYTGALYNQKLNANSELSFKVYRSKENSHLLAALLNTTDKLNLWWDGTVKGYELQNTIRTSKVNTATWGYSYETRSFTEQSNSGHSYYDYTGKSFYLQNVTNLGKLATSFGYRHYENSDNANIRTIAYNSPATQYGKGTADDPVFSLNYALSDKTNLHGSIGKSYRWPNAKERSGPGGIYPYSDTQTYLTNSDGSVTYYYVMADGSLSQGTVCDYLLPETAINRELGLGYSLHGFKFDITYFNKDITNMIKGQGFGQQHTQYYNIPHVDMHGFEVEINKKIADHVKGFLNYTYTNAFDTLLQLQVRDIPYRKFSLGLNYTGQDGLNANLALNYIGSCTSAFSNGNGNGSGDSPTRMLVQKLPSYSTVDLKVSKTVDNRDYYIKISNLFDKKYYAGAYLAAPDRYIETGVTVKFQ